MKAKPYLRILLSFIFFFSTLIFSSITFAQQLSLFDQPNQNAKVIGTVDLSTGIIPIFTPADGVWIKVADPRNGNVGWIQTNDIKNAKGSTNNAVLPQKIISNGSQQTPSNDQMQEYYQKIRVEQQVIQDSFQRVLKDINELFKSPGFPMIITAPPKSQPNQPAQNQQINPQPGTGTTQNATPAK